MSGNEKASNVIEQDTDETEDIPDLFQFLLPYASVNDSEQVNPLNISQFQLSYNNSVFQGWVKQPSPCCAAASVAGAWNALHHYSRRHPNAFQFEQIINIYQILLKEKIQKKCEAFHRKLGYFPVTEAISSNSSDSKLDGCPFDLFSESFWEEFNHRCSSRFSKQLGGKKECTITKKVMEKVLKSIIKDFFLVVWIPDPLQGKKEEGRSINWKDLEMNPAIPRSFLYCLTELYELENQSLLQEETKPEEKEPLEPLMEDGREDFKLADDNEELEEGDNDDEDEDDDNTALGKSSGVVIVIDTNASKKASKTKKKWEWRNDLLDIIKTKSGLLKLQQEKPSTAYIGNWGILESIDYLSQQYHYNDLFTARLFMGKKKLAKSKIDYPLSRKDSDETIQLQWEGMKAMFARPNHVLLFHLKNHYALIFAMREWYEVNHNKYYRQVLTARKGQRPTAWIDFHDVREIMLGWEGYKVILIRSTVEKVYAIEKSEAIFQSSPASGSSSSSSLKRK